MKTLFLPCLIFLSPVHHAFLKHTTHTHKYCPFFLRCVCTRLLGHKSFSGMDECLQTIHHPPYPPPSPLFLYQPAVTLTTDGPSLSLSTPLFLSFLPYKSFLCHFSFFSLPSAYFARRTDSVHACGCSCTLSHLPTPPPPVFFLSSCPSPSIHLSPVHHWDWSGTFRAARKKAL